MILCELPDVLFHRTPQFDSMRDRAEWILWDSGLSSYVSLFCLTLILMDWDVSYGGSKFLRTWCPRCSVG